MARSSSRRNKKAITTTTTTTAAAAKTLMATSSRRITRSIYKKHMSQICRTKQYSPSKPAATSSSSRSSTTTTTTSPTPDHEHKEEEEEEEEDGFSTPKSDKNKIPDMISTCPPAPKKARRPPPVNLSDFSQAKRTTRTSAASPTAFFAHPDIELFFFYALRDHIKV